MSIKINGKTIANSATPLPTQTGQAGKFLSTDGTSAKWEETGGKDQNTGKPLYDWIGTTAEYEAQKVATTHPDWLCYITDDVVGIPDTYTKNEVSSFLANKADKDLGNLTPQDTENILRLFGKDWSRIIKVDYGPEMVMPCTGWLHIVVDVKAGGYLSVDDEFYQSSNVSCWIGGYTFVNRGQVVHTKTGSFTGLITCEIVKCLGSI